MSDFDSRSGIGSEFGLSRAGGYRSVSGSGRQPFLGHTLLTSSGRAALSLAATTLLAKGARGRDKVLLPSYLCRSMIQPFAELGLKVEFYPLAADLTTSPDLVYERVDEHTLAVIIMRYFGFHQPDDPARDLGTRSAGIAVIDDRTHLLLSDLAGVTKSWSRALAVYSPRKWGPFPDLGVFLSPLSLDEARLGARKGVDWPLALWRLLGLLLRALFFSLPVDLLRRLSLSPFHKAEAMLESHVRVSCASPLSRLLWDRWEWGHLWQVRRDNFQYLLENWSARGAEPLFKTLPDSVCPLGFPVRAGDRDCLRQYLISHGIFPPIHWTLPDRVSPTDFPLSAALAEQELTIPIDQRYRLPQMDLILEALCQA